MSTIPMVCPRDFTLRTKNGGHVIKFEAGKETDVPEEAYHEAISKNIVPVQRKDDEGPAFTLISNEITGTLRDALIIRGIDELVKRNNTEDFTGGGMPKAAALTNHLGFQIANPETKRYWDLYKDYTSQNMDLPVHPRMELVMELQPLTSRRQLEEFAADYNINVPRAKGKNVKELKAILMNQVVNQQMPNGPGGDNEQDGTYVPASSLTAD